MNRSIHGRHYRNVQIYPVPCKARECFQSSGENFTSTPQPRGKSEIDGHKNVEAMAYDWRGRMRFRLRIEYAATLPTVSRMSTDGSGIAAGGPAANNALTSLLLSAPSKIRR